MAKTTEANKTIDAYSLSILDLRNAHAEYLRAEINHRVERRRAESKARTLNPSTPSAALDLLVEANPEYTEAQERWVRAQYERTQAIGFCEVHKLRAWLAVRSVG